MTGLDIPCVVLRVSKYWYPGIDDDTLYDVTRGWWVMGSKRERAEYAVAVAGGVVRGVWLIHGWRPRHHQENGSAATRWGFDGEPADDQAHLIGMDVKHLFALGAANPVRYFNLDKLPAAPDPMWATPDAQSDARVSSLADLCESLLNNMVLHLSLGSKELFHSNYLGRLFELSADIAIAALHPVLVPDPTATMHQVWRERNHLDLVVHLPGYRPVVIENKVFSIPDEAQLEGYAAHNIPKAGLVTFTPVLLSLGGDHEGHQKF